MFEKGMTYARRCEAGSVRKPLIIHSMIWATLIVATALVLETAEANRNFTYMLLTVFIPLWFASDRLFRSVLVRHTGRDKDR